MAQRRYRARPYSQDEIQEVLMTVASYCGNVDQAHRHLIEEHGHAPRPHTISGWISGPHAEAYSTLREQHQERHEQEITERLRGTMASAVEATQLGVQKARERLEAGEEHDPARAAANLATVVDKSTRDYLHLQGRPTSIRQERNLEETLRSLIGAGILSVAGGEPEQLEAPAEDATE